MSVILVCILCLINLFLWFLFFKKFNKLFSTDDIIESTKSELNKMILDVNRNAERNITLIESRINDLKSVIAEADDRLSMVKSKQQKQKMESAYTGKIDSVLHNGSPVSNRAAQAYKKNSNFINPDSSYEVNSEVPENGGQKSLFESEKKRLEPPSAAVSEDGSSYTDVPLLKTNVYMADNPIVIKKSFNEEVRDRYQKGQTIEEIAAALSRSVTEVQFVLDLNE